MDMNSHQFSFDASSIISPMIEDPFHNPVQTTDDEFDELLQHIGGTDILDNLDLFSIKETSGSSNDNLLIDPSFDLLNDVSFNDSITSSNSPLRSKFSSVESPVTSIS